MTKAKKFKKNYMRKILSAESRRKSLSLADLLTNTGISPSKMRSLTSADSSSRMRLCEQVAAYLGIDPVVGKIAISGVDWLAELLYEYPDSLELLEMLHGLLVKKNFQLESLVIKSCNALLANISRHPNIAALWASGASMDEICKKFGICRQTALKRLEEEKEYKKIRLQKI